MFKICSNDSALQRSQSTYNHYGERKSSNQFECMYSEKDQEHEHVRQELQERYDRAASYVGGQEGRCRAYCCSLSLLHRSRTLVSSQPWNIR
jgi:hypothetical protein